MCIVDVDKIKGEVDIFDGGFLYLFFLLQCSCLVDVDKYLTFNKQLIFWSRAGVDVEDCGQLRKPPPVVLPSTSWNRMKAYGCTVHDNSFPNAFYP